MKYFTQKFFALAIFLMMGGFVFSQDPFWIEDFDGGLPAEWTAVEVAGDMSATSNWMWTSTGPAGPFAIGALASTTAANGWMIFDSDLNCSGEQDVWLVSPKIDLTGRDLVFLQFETRYRRFNDVTSIEVSTDSVNWTAVPVFGGAVNGNYGDLSTNGTVNPQNVTVDLTSFGANQGEFWFAFHFLADNTTVLGGTDIGCAYSWQVDDVKLIDFDPTPAFNLSLGDFFYSPASFAQPVSQVKTDTMGFFADISNIGNQPLTNVVLKAQIRNSGGTTIFADSLIIASVETGVTDSTYFIDGVFVPDQLGIGDYTIAYNVYSLDVDDADMSNNSASRPFTVTENLWAKESQPTIAYRPGGGPANYHIGNLYTTSNDWVDTYMATKATFSAAMNAADGNLLNKVVNIVLVEVREDLIDAGWNNFDDALDFASNPGLALRSFNEHTFNSATNFANQTTNLVDFDDDDLPGVVLKPGNRYLLLAAYENANNVIFHSFSEAISYFQISTVIWNGGSSTWFLGGFGPEPAAQLRLEIDLFNTADEKPLPDNALTYFPNPASTKLNVQLSLEEPTLANVTLADLNGRVILIDEIQNAQQNSLEYNVSHLPAGTYLVRVATKNGTSTKKFIVAR